MNLVYILSFVSFFLFFFLIFFTINPRRFYLLFIIYLLPIMDLAITPTSWGGIKVFDGISFLTFFVLFKDFMYIRKDHKSYFILFSLLILTLIIGSMTSEYINYSLVNILSILSVFIFAKCLINECFVDEDFYKKVIQGLKFVAIFSIFFLAVQIIVGLNFTFYTEVNKNTQDYRGFRYPSFFHDPQKYGQFMSMLGFLFLINYKQIEKPRFKNYLLFIMIIAGILATGGRAPIIALFASMVLMFFFLGIRYKIILLTVGLVSGILIVSLSDSLLILKRSETINEDYLIRASLWDEAYQIFKHHPLFGIGLGNFYNFAVSHSSNYFINPENKAIFFDQPESGYFMILTEVGAFGFVFIFTLVALPIFTTINRYRKRNRNLILIFFIAAILSWFISFVSLYTISDKRILIVLVTLVCFLIAMNNSKVKNANYIK